MSCRKILGFPTFFSQSPCIRGIIHFLPRKIIPSCTSLLPAILIACTLAFPASQCPRRVHSSRCFPFMCNQYHLSCLLLQVAHVIPSASEISADIFKWWRLSVHDSEAPLRTSTLSMSPFLCICDWIIQIFMPRCLALARNVRV